MKLDVVSTCMRKDLATGQMTFQLGVLVGQKEAYVEVDQATFIAASSGQPEPARPAAAPQWEPPPATAEQDVRVFGGDAEDVLVDWRTYDMREGVAALLAANNIPYAVPKSKLDALLQEADRIVSEQEAAAPPLVPTVPLAPTPPPWNPSMPFIQQVPGMPQVVMPRPARKVDMDDAGFPLVANTAHQRESGMDDADDPGVGQS